MHLQHTGAGWERNQHFCQNLPSGPGRHSEGISTFMPNFQAKVAQNKVSLHRLIRDSLNAITQQLQLYTLIPGADLDLSWHNLVWLLVLALCLYTEF